MTRSAIDVRARLAAARAGDPGLRRFGAAEHHYALRPPLDGAAVAAFEARHAVVLPTEYRRFLLEVGSCGAGPHYGLYPLDGSGMEPVDLAERELPGHLATSFPHTEAWNPAGTMSEQEYSADGRTTGSLVVCHFGCGALYRLVVTGPARGQVWFDDRCSAAGLTPGPGFDRWYGDWLHAL
ncbi:SMI1/KNR4 family protein [Pseudonocardia humida]|uniref:SMI1/KNR4 family protein n=1 Tax=Pseudonocardia humida TaxID=2800819 RepID=A0ABT1A1D2_9PSEU|nr:SMI1/KNR4 family protein [Pseudonocardia humida]MCO1656814.1 SMI1/KNR4 family protein [Pseudonocardia humida]